MVNLVKINKHGELFVTPYETVDAARAAIEEITPDAPVTISQNESGCTIINRGNNDTTYIITNHDYAAFTVSVPGGKLMANTALDPLYPGIDIEYIADDEEKLAKDADVFTRPRVLIEKPRETKTLAAMIWGDKNNKGYTHKTVFEKNPSLIAKYDTTVRDVIKSDPLGFIDILNYASPRVSKYFSKLLREAACVIANLLLTNESWRDINTKYLVFRTLCEYSYRFSCCVVSPRQIAGTLNIHPDTVLKYLLELVDEGLAEPEPKAENEFKLTEKGKATDICRTCIEIN